MEGIFALRFLLPRRVTRSLPANRDSAARGVSTGCHRGTHGRLKKDASFMPCLRHLFFDRNWLCILYFDWQLPGNCHRRMHKIRSSRNYCQQMIIIDQTIFNSSIPSSCRERGSNPHGAKPHRILSPVRLPVPPSRLACVFNYLRPSPIWSGKFSLHFLSMVLADALKSPSSHQVHHTASLGPPLDCGLALGSETVR
jgi:hypothetical protein